MNTSSTHSPARGLGAAGEAIFAFESQVRQLEDITEQIRNTHNSIEECKGNIRVICRVRPPNSKELGGGGGGGAAAAAAAATKDNHNHNHNHNHNNHKGYQPIELLTQYDVGVKDKTYEFYRVYGPENTQEDVFGELRGLVTSAVQGYHLSVLAYGQTGSGKTFTMMGPEEDRGVNFRVLAELFQQQKSSNRRFETTMSAIEIYNEAVYDLLAPASSAATTALHVREDKRLGPYVEELSVHQVVAAGEAERVLERAVANRTVRSTEANRESSRSHCVVTISVRSWPADGSSGPATEGKLHLVDLAGSERIGSKPDMSKAQGDELKNINLSLTTLRRCLEALRTKRPHVPFRESLLTFLLKQSFSGDGKVVMICNVGPAATAETINSIEFCTNVRAVELGLGKLHEGGASSTAKAAQRLAELQALHAELISRREALRAQIEERRKVVAVLRQKYEEKVLLLGGGAGRPVAGPLGQEINEMRWISQIANLEAQIASLRRDKEELKHKARERGDTVKRQQITIDKLEAQIREMKENDEAITRQRAELQQLQQQLQQQASSSSSSSLSSSHCLCHQQAANTSNTSTTAPAPATAATAAPAATAPPTTGKKSQPLAKSVATPKTLSAVGQPMFTPSAASTLTGAPRRFLLEHWSCPRASEDQLVTSLIRDHVPNPVDVTPVVASVLVHCVWQYRSGGEDGAPSLHLETGLLAKASAAFLELSGSFDLTRSMMVYWLSNVTLLRHFAKCHQAALPADHLVLSELRTAMTRLYFQFFTSIKQDLAPILVPAFAAEDEAEAAALLGEVCDTLTNARHLLRQHDVAAPIIEIFSLEVYEWVCGCVFNAVLTNKDMFFGVAQATRLGRHLNRFLTLATKAEQEPFLVSSRSWRRANQAAALLVISNVALSQRPGMVAEIAPELSHAQLAALFAGKDGAYPPCDNPGVLVELNPPSAFAGPRAEGVGEEGCDAFDRLLAGGQTLISAYLKGKLTFLNMPDIRPSFV